MVMIALALGVFVTLVAIGLMVVGVHSWRVKPAAPVTSIMPFGGKREIARRARQLERGMIHIN